MLCLFLFFLAFRQPEAVLTLTVSPVKATFQAGEPVVISITIVNNGKTAVSIDKGFLAAPDEHSGGELALFLTGPGEIPLPFQVFFQPSALTKQEIIRLSPDESISRNLTLSDCFSTAESGKYVLQAVYNTTEMNSRFSFWRGKIIAQPVTFSIVPKEQGREETKEKTDQAFTQLVKAREAAISRALSTHKIETPKNWDVRFDPDSRADWLLDSSGKGTLGSGAFQSPAWLASSLTALAFLLEHSSKWPVTNQDFHLCMALSNGEILSKTKELGLSADEISLLLDESKIHEENLDSSHKEKLEKGEWPESLPFVISDALKDSVLYTPPVVQSSDRFFLSSLLANDEPAADVPVLLAVPLEAGFEILGTASTDKNGHVFFPVPETVSSLKPFLFVVPILRNGPFPHIVPIQPSSSPVEQPYAMPPSLSSLPQAVEPSMEETLSGKNLLLNGKETLLTLGERQLPLLAAAPSLILTRVPALMPGSSVMQISTPGGLLSLNVPVAVIQADLKEKTVHTGQKTELTIVEDGAPLLNVWIALDRPFLVFSDGSIEKTLQLEARKPVSLALQGSAPGKFRLTFGVSNPAREKAFAKLEEMASILQDDEDKKLADDALWALREGQIGVVESLLEELRLEALLRENKMLPVEQVLVLIP